MAIQIRTTLDEPDTAAAFVPHKPARPDKAEGGRPFKLVSEYDPAGDQPTAIAELVEAAEAGDKSQVLLGVTGSGKTFTMAKVIERTQRPALILAPNKAKLSKRKHGEVVSLTTYRDRGFVPAAFRNFLALLGWSSPDGKEILTREEMIERFTLEGIGRANAIFNFHENDPRRWTDDKALWMNAEYIRTLPLSEVLPMVRVELRSSKLWREEYDEDEREWFERTVELIRHRFFTLKDFSSQGRAYFSEDFDFEEAAVRKNILKDVKLKELLPGLADRLESIDPFTAANVEGGMRAFADAEGVKAGLLINGSRTMLTGQSVGPSMFEVFEILGRDRSVMRLRSQRPWNEFS